jgi:hypothetical protein
MNRKWMSPLSPGVHSLTFLHSFLQRPSHLCEGMIAMNAYLIKTGCHEIKVAVIGSSFTQGKLFLCPSA